MHRSLLIALGMTIVTGSLLFGAFRLWDAQSLAQWESRVQRSLSEARAQLETEIYSNIHLGTRLAAYVDSHPAIDEVEFSAYARELLTSTQHAVRYLAYAPDHVIRYIYPTSGTHALIGSNLSAQPELAAVIAELRLSRHRQVSGPYEPVQDHRALIVHEPLFAAELTRSLPSLIGQVDVQIDLEQIYRYADLYRISEGIDLSLRLIEAAGNPGEVLFGRANVFVSQPILTEVLLPGMRLELGAIPHGGWRAVEPFPIFLPPLAALLLALVFTVSYRMALQTRRLRDSEARMRKTSDRLTTLLAAMPNVVGIIDSDGRIQDIFGGQGQARMHVDPERMVGRRLDELLPAPTARALLAAMGHSLRENTLQVVEYCISEHESREMADGSWPQGEQWFRSVVAPMKNGSSTATCTLWITENITETRQAEIALLRSHNRYRQLTNTLQQVVFETDEHGLVTFINPAWASLAGPSAPNPVGQAWTELLHPDYREEMARMFGKLMARRCSTIHQDVRLGATGNVGSWVNTYLIPVAGNGDAGISGAIGTLFDINERKRNESAIRHQALHDPLTGLPNRLLLIERLDHALTRMRRQGSRLAVMFVDLDNFKAINDQHGHLAGDQVLQQASRRLRDQVREIDTVARIGGDEFIVLLESVPDQDAVHIVANKLVTAMCGPFELLLDEGSAICHIGASIGIAMAPRDGGTVDALLHLADRHLYQAKAAGKGVSRSGAG